MDQEVQDEDLYEFEILLKLKEGKKKLAKHFGQKCGKILENKQNFSIVSFSSMNEP